MPNREVSSSFELLGRAGCLFRPTLKFFFLLFSRRKVATLNFSEATYSHYYRTV